MPSYTQAIFAINPIYLQTRTYSAKDDRKPLSDLVSPGVVGTNDYLVSLTAGLGISIAGGAAYVLGQNVADQGTYRQYSGGAVVMAVTAADVTYPRLDQVILRMMDGDADTSGAYEGRIEIVPGVPTAGATLGNRNGHADLTALLENSKNVLLLADILVPANAVSLNVGNLADKRVLASFGGAIQDYLVKDKLYLGSAKDTYLSRISAGVVGSNGGLLAAQNDALALQLTGAAAGITIGGDTNLYRSAVVTLKTDNFFHVGLRLIVNPGSVANQIMLNNDGTIYFGTAVDTDLYRVSSGVLKTDGAFDAAGDIRSQRNSAPQSIIGAVGPSAEAGILFGSGLDTSLYRVSAGIVGTTGGLLAARNDAQALQLTGSSSGLTIGSDTNLYRSAADRLNSDDLFAAALGIATKQKAGAPVDGDWAVAPPNGTLIVDSTNNKIWARVGGVWKGVVIA